MYVSSCIIFISLAKPLTSFDNLWHKNHRIVFTFHYLTVYIPVKNAKKKPLWHLLGPVDPSWKILFCVRGDLSNFQEGDAQLPQTENWEVNVYFFSESFWWWLLIHLPPCAERYWPVAFVTIQSAKPYQLKKIQIKKYKFILNEQHELSFFLLLKPTFKDKRQNCNKKCTFKPNFDNTDKTIRLLIV